MLNYQRVYVRDFVGIGWYWYWIAVSSFYLVIIPSLQQSPKPETEMCHVLDLLMGHYVPIL